MQNYNPIYRKFIDDKNVVTGTKMTRGNFYLIKEYTYVDGTKGKFTETNGPIIYTLFQATMMFTLRIPTNFVV